MSEVDYQGLFSEETEPHIEAKIIGSPSSRGSLVHHGETVDFEVVQMIGAEIIERLGDRGQRIICVTSALDRNGPMQPGPSDLPTQMQRIHLYLRAQEAEAATDSNSLAYRKPTTLKYSQAKVDEFYLSARLKLF